jgi:cysteine desulfurase
VGERTYLDWNAGAPLLPEAAAAVVALLGGPVGNPASAHAEGRRARDVVEDARLEVAALLGVPQDAIVFTSGGSEANAAAVHGLLAGAPAGGALLLPRSEHPSLLAAASQAERRGASVRFVAVRSDGVVDLDHLASLLAAGRATAVCLQLANSETGVLQPVREAAALARARGAAVVCDAVQAAGRVALDVGALGADVVTLSAHKLGGLAGTGALVSTRALEPLVPGTQERHRRGGSENVVGIAAFAAAVRVARREQGRWAGTAALRDALERAVLAQVPGTTVYGAGAARLPNTSCIGLPAPLDGGVMVAALDLRGFAVSSGTACSSGAGRGSATVAAMGFGGEAARRSLRVSLGPETTEADVLGFVDALAEAAAAWRRG